MDTYVFDDRALGVDPREIVSEEIYQNGVTRTYRVTEQLVVICNFYENIKSVAYETKWKLNFNGWVSFHYRIEGISREVFADGIESTMGGRTFIATASNIKDFSYREVMGDTWMTVTIMCKPDLLKKYQMSLDVGQPIKDNHLACNDSAKEISCVTGQLSEEMYFCVLALMKPKVEAAFYACYYKAKALELICLTYNQVSKRNSEGDHLSVKLSKQDLLCIYEARNKILSLISLPSLSELARSVGVNRNKLSVGFKFVFGSTIGEFHRNKRLEEAYNRLIKREASISVISFDAGYNDQGSFSKAFKTKFGILPSEVAQRAESH